MQKLVRSVYLLTHCHQMSIVHFLQNKEKETVKDLDLKQSSIIFLTLSHVFLMNKFQRVHSEGNALWTVSFPLKITHTLITCSNYIHI